MARKRKKKPPLGTGQRFDQLSSALAQRPGVKNPGALAAYIGRKKYSKAGFQKLSAGGKNKNQTVTAVGRELLGFIWDIAVRTERQYPPQAA